LALDANETESPLGIIADGIEFAIGTAIGNAYRSLIEKGFSPQVAAGMIKGHLYKLLHPPHFGMVRQ